MSKRVLIADDEPSIVTALEFLLQRAGYEVRVARDGDETLELIDAYNPPTSTSPSRSRLGN
jgi:DNA-binding response OmpR family regulator